MIRWFSRLGPGLMLAAAAIGVSHLVQATRAGADFGLSFVWLVVLVALIKYPAFRFAIDYASVSDRSLVHAYARMGRIPLYWLLVAFFVDMFIATAAVSLVTAGLFISVFKLPFSGPHVAVAIVVAAALFLLNGRYQKAEKLIKGLVVVFTALTIVAMVVALPMLGEGGRHLFAELTPSRSLAVFVIAMAGWMPMPMSGAIFVSSWACEKKKSGGDAFQHRQAVFDLQVGWVLTVVVAIAFMVMGTAILFETDRAAPASAGAFATELLSVFTTLMGAWAYPLISAAAIAVMLSTVVALLDVLPRVTASLIDHARGASDVEHTSYTALLLVQVIGVTLIMLLLLSNFNAFIIFATSTAFLTAPAIAYYNYRAVTSAEIAQHYRPSAALLLWHRVGLASLSAFALAYFLDRIIHEVLR